MCGRFTLASPAETITETFGPFGPADDGSDEVPELAPRYNIAPTQSVAVIRETARPGGTGRRLEIRRWGLVPHFARRLSGPPLFNARAETLAQKPAFRDAYRRRRCLIPADGFFEWRSVSGRRQPFHIRRQDGAPFGMAGLWETWRPAAGEGIDSCTIVTTRANALVAPLHDRMPVILPNEAFAPWLDPAPQSPDALAHWLEPAPDEGWIAYPVDPQVNHARHDAPSNVEPIFDEAP